MKYLKIIKDDPSFSEGKYNNREDAFDHEAIAETLLRVIKDNEPPLTIGLFGGWGVGKSSIINLLESKCKSKTGNFRFISFNAWAYSGDSLRRQLLLAIAKGLIKDDTSREVELTKLRKLNYAQTLEDTPGHSLKDLIDKARGEGFWKALKVELFSAFEHTKVAEQGIVGIFISIIFLLVGVTLLIWGGIENNGEIQRWSMIWFFLMGANLFFPKVENIFVLKKREVFDARLIFPEQFEEEYNRLLEKYATDVKKVIIVIDDLDRCDAETIKSVLIILKNFMGRGKSIFVVPMDDSSVVRMFKGENTNFGYEQLRKYFSISVRIPQFHQEDLLDFARQMSEEYEIPSRIAYIAAQGYCTDARKMKHFLNLYKLKYAIAEARAKSKFLGNIDLESISEQLAKIVVLEYQFPEFYRFISIYPETIDLFSEASIDNKKAELDKISWKEINDELEDAQNPNIESLWRNQPGLRQFLRATHDIALENFDVVSKLKTTNQEHSLTEVGVEIKNAITKGTQIDLDKYLTKEYAAEKGQSVVDTLTKYFDPDFDRPARSAIYIALEVLKRNILLPTHQYDLFRNMVSAVTHVKVGAKISGKDSRIFLENIDRIGQRQQIDLAKKIITDIFVPEVFDPEFWRILTHSVIKKTLGFYSDLKGIIESTTENWAANLKEVDKVHDFVKGIQEVKLSRKERKSIGLNFPSNVLLSHLSESLMTDVPEIDDKIVSTIIDDNNPEEFNDKVIGLSSCLTEVILACLSEGDFKPAMTTACQGLIDMPLWLNKKNSVDISTSIQSNFENFSQEDEKQLLLELMLICFCSIDTDEPEKKILRKAYLELTDLLSADQVDVHAKRSIHDNLSEDDPRKEAIADVFARRWAKIKSSIDNPKSISLENVNLCKSNKFYIGDKEYTTLLPTLFGLKDVQAIREWSDFIINEIAEMEEPAIISTIDLVFGSFTNVAFSMEVRLEYGDLLLKLLEKFQVNIGMPYYQKIYNMIDCDDRFNLDFATTNFSRLRDRFGNDVPRIETNSIAERLLEKNEIGTYSKTVDIILKFTESIQETVWNKLTEKICNELPNESLDVGHRWQLLHLATDMRRAIIDGTKLSEVLFAYKESGQVDELRKKSWEVYERLTRNQVIPNYIPPVKPQPEESTKVEK